MSLIASFRLITNMVPLTAEDRMMFDKKKLI